MYKPDNILFFDLEVHKKTRRILEIGALLNGQQYKGKDLQAFAQLAETATIICGHNVINHDIPMLNATTNGTAITAKPAIDTLFLSALLFPKKPYHHLVKDYQLVGTTLNNPLYDAELCKTLLGDLMEAFYKTPTPLQRLYFNLLQNHPGFDGFFLLFKPELLPPKLSLEQLTESFKTVFSNITCNQAQLKEVIIQHPAELALAAALISTNDPNSLPPPWVLHQFPEVQKIINQLRVHCNGLHGCPYCAQLHPKRGLQKYFGFPEFRRFPEDGPIPLQQQVVEAALAAKSLIAIFPTGGGKSLTFQLPALMKGAANHALTVIISPLQSLMKDQVDVLQQRHDITSAVTINGMLSPLERSEALERVRAGGANLLYISPESLRSNSIFNLLKGRQINRFVIDEAHCFSAWGQDFRVDYLYIGPFLKKLQDSKLLAQPIPVSCFTATAKPAVIEDIQQYFKAQLDQELQLFQTSAKRNNLSYFVIPTDGPEQKLQQLIDLLQSQEGPKIVYVSRVKTSEMLAEQLRQYSFRARAYNGKMERDVKIKVQNDFMQEDNELDIIVATSAFGMGVDKDNVKMVIHYNISDSLENYMQESGRAGRRPALQAQCFILFDRNDLDGHFSLLNATKISHKEVYQIWQGIKRFRKKNFTKSALEIAKQAGWDIEINQLETRVKGAIAALEDAGYVKREENLARIFAQSIAVKNMNDASRIIDQNSHFFVDKTEQQNAKRVFNSLISRARTDGDIRVDWIAEALGLKKSTVTHLINLFKQLHLLIQDKDLSAYLYTVQGKRNSLHVFQATKAVEQAMADSLFPNEQVLAQKFFLRELNEAIIEKDLECNPLLIRNVLNYWSIANFVEKERIDRNYEQYRLRLKMPLDAFLENIRDRNQMAAYCLQVFQMDYLAQAESDPDFSDKRLMKFSVMELKKKIETFVKKTFPIRFYELLLLYLHHINAIELKGGLMVFYNPMKIIRQELNNRKKYTQDDYGKLAQYYQSRVEQIHIVGEYAKRQLKYTEEATQYVEDYFTLDYQNFISKYFPKRKTDIRRPITEEKFQQIIVDLSPEQLKVVNDNQHDNILVAAGPGSGKTRVLVHKVASLVLMEDIKPEQFLMLTFSRPAALEFKSRIQKLIGKVAYYIDIFTYHGFAFHLAGRLGNLEKAKDILTVVTEAIKQEEIPLDRIQNKAVLVVDEYQDVSEEEYQFMMAIVDKAEKIRVIVVGDDDQNIYEFRGSSVKYIRDFVEKQEAMVYYLQTNYRAKKNLLAFTNQFLDFRFSKSRIKANTPLKPDQQDNGFIEITKYHSRHLIIPILESVKSKKLVGTTAILTHTNEEAVLLATLLQQNDLNARLIMEKPGFALRDLLELQTFSYFLFQEIKDELGLITETSWAAAKTKLENLYPHSANMDLMQRIWQDFEQSNPKKFKSSWGSFLKESRIEHFYHAEKNVLLVSTMHKVKGKEFDNVFILLHQYPLDSEAGKRVLYVAMTRAKNNLFIHTNNINFRARQIEDLHYAEDQNQWPAPDTLVLQCSMADIWLGFFKRKDVTLNIKELTAGQSLRALTGQPAILATAEGLSILRFSKKFKETLQHYFDKGYTLQSANAKFIVVWFDKETGERFRVVLPELWLVNSN